MDLSEALVDLLLVRLGREEERQRVVELLVNELRMTREQARKAVDSTPTVLMEAVPMGQARVIQNRLYPFVDLLPRMDSVSEEPEQPPQPAVRAPDASAASAGAEGGFTSGAGIGQDEAPMRRKETPPQATKARMQPVDVVGPAQRRPESDEFKVTSASEEVLSIERCHVCGRTPTGVEKLAPCRSCAEPTCRDCFDRVAHVCQKCASEGKVVDSPLSRTAKTPLQPLGRSGSAAEEQEAERPSIARLIPIFAILVVLGLAAVVVFVDPFGLHLLGPAPRIPVGADSTAAVRDTLPDTTAVIPDTATAVVLTGVIDPAGLSALPLPEGVTPGQFESPIPVDDSQVPSGTTTLHAEATALQSGFSSIAASVPIAVDRFSVLRVGDSTIVIAFAILHPEEDNRRYDLLRKIGTWLAPSGVDEIAFYYSENQYYPVRTVSFRQENFGRLRDAMGPVDFQNLAGSSSEEVWAVLTGSVQNWMARY
jgi:hypothetical protein